MRQLPKPPSRQGFKPGHYTCGRWRCVHSFNARFSAYIVTAMLGRKCFICGSVAKAEGNRIPGFELHHRKYESDSVIGSNSMQRRREALAHPNRFCLLCKPCHNLVNRVHHLPKSGQFRLRKLVTEQAANWAKLERLKLDAKNGVRTRGGNKPTPEEWIEITLPGRVTAKEYNFWEDISSWQHQDDEEND